MEAILIMGLVIFLVVAIAIGPHLFIWSINWIAEIGGVEFYMDHSLWSWWVAFIFLSMVRGTLYGRK